MTAIVDDVSSTRLHWPPIIERAAEIVEASALPMTLRQVHYLLVSENLIPNTPSAYQRLSRLSAQARRAGSFPRLVDLGRKVERPPSWDGPADALAFLARHYRRDRTDGQRFRVYLGVEKQTLLGLMGAWFGQPLGIPVIPVRGWSSQTLVDDVADEVAAEIADESADDPRKTILLYVGDLDPAGLYIPEDFVRRADCFDHVERVALLWGDVDGLAESIQPAKPKDANLPRFRAEAAAKGRPPVQVEIEAMPPDQLRARVEAALDRWWDPAAVDRVRSDEDADRTVLRRLADTHPA